MRWMTLWGRWARTWNFGLDGLFRVQVGRSIASEMLGLSVVMWRLPRDKVIEGEIAWRIYFGITLPPPSRWARVNPASGFFAYDSARWTGRPTFDVEMIPLWWKWRPVFFGEWR